MYIVKLHCYNTRTNHEWTNTSDEYFSSLKAAVRYGMRIYRMNKEIIDFRAEEIIPRGWAEKLW